LVIGRRYDLHHVEPGSFEYRDVGRLHVHHVELRDDVVGIRTNWERNCTQRACLVLVKLIQIEIGLED